MIELRVTELCQYAKTDLDSVVANLRDTEITAKMNLGSAYHAFILRNKRDDLPKEMGIIEYANYLSNGAKEAKKLLLEQGKIPLLKPEYEKIMSDVKFLEPAINEIFPISAEFEKELSLKLNNDVNIVGHIDCLTGDKVIDLKISSVSYNLDKHIYDMRYNLQLYIYMLLANKQEAELVFVNTKSLTINVKTLSFGELSAECEKLLELAQKNYFICQEALSKPLVRKTAYNVPMWAYNELMQGE